MDADLVTSIAAGVATVISAGQLAGDVRASKRGKDDRQHATNVTLRLLYGEVLFNVIALQVGAKVTPARFLYDDKVYRGLVSSGQIALISSSVDDIGTVSAAYSILTLASAVFDQDWLALVSIRAIGADCKALDMVAVHFRQAEAVLRRLAWTDEQRIKVEAQLTSIRVLEPATPPGLLRRIRSAGVVPGSIVAGAVWFGVWLHRWEQSRHR